jgi:hypothetical protein
VQEQIQYVGSKDSENGKEKDDAMPKMFGMD